MSSATEAVVACGCEVAGVISAVLGVLVGGRYCIILGINNRTSRCTHSHSFAETQLNK